MKKLDTVSFIIVNDKEYLNIHNILTKQNPFRTKTHDFNQTTLEALCHGTSTEIVQNSRFNIAETSRYLTHVRLTKPCRKPTKSPGRWNLSDFFTLVLITHSLSGQRNANFQVFEHAKNLRNNSIPTDQDPLYPRQRQTLQDQNWSTSKKHQKAENCLASFNLQKSSEVFWGFSKKEYPCMPVRSRSVSKFVSAS